MRAQLLPRRLRGRSASLHTVPPAPGSPEYSSALAAQAARLLYRSPLPSREADRPVYILSAADFPDPKTTDYDALLGYVLARLPDEESLIRDSRGYELVFFAGDSGGAEGGGGRARSASSPDTVGDGGATGSRRAKPGRPSWAWIANAYQALPRAVRKRLQRLYLVHEKRWVRLAAETFANLVSPKFRRKLVHASTLSALALHLPLEDLLVPPAAYVFDRTRLPRIDAPYASGRRAFGAANPLPAVAAEGGGGGSSSSSVRLPRVLREATSFVLAPPNVGQEGLFRVNARATTIDVLREAYDRGQKFILWREGAFHMAFPHYREGHGDVSIEEPDVVDGYGLNAAAGLIKLWYAELREPVFSEAAYPYLQRVYGDAGSPIEVSQLRDLLRADADWSPASPTARRVLTTHLLPLLAEVTRHPGNKMTPHNLAVCFAPGLVRSDDPVADAKITATVTRLLAAAVTHWTTELCAACGGVDAAHFHTLLQTPSNPADREDPLETAATAAAAAAASPTHHGVQTAGILLLSDAESSSAAEDDDAEAEGGPPPPPLPPRTDSDGSALASPASGSTVTSVPRRRPAPEPRDPPRYSTLVARNDAQRAQADAAHGLGAGVEGLHLGADGPVQVAAGHGKTMETVPANASLPRGDYPPSISTQASATGTAGAESVTTILTEGAAVTAESPTTMAPTAAAAGGVPRKPVPEAADKTD